jgi:hypothetical protein
MIFVTRKEEETSQKIVANFLKRVKKSNLIQRSRKTKFHNKKLTKRVIKDKAIKTVKYFAANEYNSATSKK